MSSQNTPHMSKLESASLLVLGMESLKPGKPIPLSSAVVEAAGNHNDAFDLQKYGMALTCAVLYAIVVELVLKHIWEKEQGETAEHNHNVYSLFVQLNPKTRCDVKALYDQCCHAYESAIDIGQQQHGAEVVAVDMANFEEALQWNEEAVKHLKYEMVPCGKTVPTGIIWSPECVWVVPKTFPNFAIELTRWAAKSDFT